MRCDWIANYLSQIVFQPNQKFVSGRKNVVHYYVLFPGSVCPSPKLPITGNSCAPSEAIDRGCSYEDLVHVLGGVANCCCDQCDVDLTCNSTSEAALWASVHSPLCPVAGCGLEGEVFYCNISCSYLIFRRKCYLTKLPWRISLQPSKNRNNKSSGRTNTTVGVH